MRVLANREGLLFASDRVRVPDSEDFAATGVAEDEQAVTPTVMELLDLGGLRPQLADGGVSKHDAQL